MASDRVTTIAITIIAHEECCV